MVICTRPVKRLANKGSPRAVYRAGGCGQHRLEAGSGVAQPDQIIISGTTHQLVKAEIGARALGSVNLRGRSGPVDIYEV